MTSCAISGHRPTRFKFGYKETHTGCKRLKRVMREQFDLLYQQGVREFYVGGALGVDMWAAEILLRMKEQSAYSDLLLHMVLPFAGHDENWDERSRERLRFIMRHCADTVIIGIPGQLPLACYKLRNQYLVDHADCLLAVYDSDRSIRSGTGQTVHYAQRRGLHPIILVHPDTFDVCCLLEPVADPDAAFAEVTGVIRAEKILEVLTAPPCIHCEWVQSAGARPMCIDAAMIPV